MKKVFFALAVVAMFSFAACNGNANPTEDTSKKGDTTPKTEVTTPENNVQDSAVKDMAEPENNEQEQANKDEQPTK